MKQEAQPLCDIFVMRAQKRLIEHTTDRLYRKPIFDKKISKKSLLEELETAALENFEFGSPPNKNIS